MIPTNYTCAECGKEVNVEYKSDHITLVYPCEECGGEVRMSWTDKNGTHSVLI